jgi:hypothetical protein
MKSDFDFSKPELFGTVVFRPSFNSYEKLSANKAWSLFFTAGREDKKLGFNPEAGRLFNNLLIATGLVGSIWAILFTRLA